MKVLEFPNRDAEADRRTERCSEHINEVLSNNKIIAFVLFAVDEKGQMISAGQGMAPADYAMCSIVATDMARGALRTEVKP